MREEKYIILDKKPLITEEEFNKKKDFMSVYSKYHTKKNPFTSAFNRFANKWLTFSVVFVIFCSALYFFWTVQPQEALMSTNRTKVVVQGLTLQKEVENSKSNPSTVSLQLPNETTEKKDSTKQPEVPLKEEEKITPLKKEQPILPKHNEAANQKKEGINQQLLVEDEYIGPHPIAGFPALYEYYNSNMKYPESAAEDSISGKVLVVFKVTKTGDIKDIRIQKSLGLDFDKEALRLISNMPQWKPATLNGEEIDKYIALPIVFQGHSVTLKTEKK